MARVLVAENDRDVGVVVSEILRGEGHSVTVVADYRSGLRQLGDLKWDILIANVFIGVDGSGIDLARIAEAVGTRALLMTGSPEVKQIAGELGFPCLRQPFRAVEIIAQVEALIAST